MANEAALQEFITGNNFFAASVYKEITERENENFLVSPLSAEIVLALTLSGSKGATAEELRAGLHLPEQETTHTAIKSLQTTLHKTDNYTFNSANKIYLKNEFQVRDDFKKIAVEVFGSEVESIDFDQKEVAAEIINGWVEEKTERKINNLINSDSINHKTRAILINALYFKAKWSSAFLKKNTNKQDFYKVGNEVIQVDMMHDYADRNYYVDEELKARFMEIPFQGNEATLTIVLPIENDGISALEKQMEKVVTTPKFETKFLSIALPKFQFGSFIDFTEILKKLGVKKIFEKGADLSGISGEKGDLVVNEVIQKTYFDASEEGVKAAAATAVTHYAFLCADNDWTPPEEFIVDHPFIFYIKIKGLIIFAGRVMDPAS